MNYKMLVAKTREKVLYANEKIDFYKRALQHPANKKSQSNFEEEFDYYDTIDTMLNRIEVNLQRWLELLQADCVNSKGIIANEIKEILKGIEE